MSGRPLGNVLVTGGAGFIGCALSKRLIDSSDRWLAIDSLNSRVHGAISRPARLHEDVELVVADIVDEATWTSVLAGFRPDTVIHLAAETDTGLSLDNVGRFARVNALGTATMLDAFSRSEIIPRHIILASSRAVYGEGTWRRMSDGVIFSPGQRSHEQLAAHRWDFPDAQPQPERAAKTFPNPTSIYGATKHVQETLLSAWCGARGTDLTALRMQNVYGPGQSLLNPYTGILPLFARIASAGDPIHVYEDGRMLRDFVHVTDVVEAFAAATLLSRAQPGGVYDIGSGVATSVMDVATLVSDAVDGPSPQVSAMFRDGDVRHAWCDAEPTTEALGWSARVMWQDGIRDYVTWFSEQSMTPVDTAGGRQGGHD